MYDVYECPQRPEEDVGTPGTGVRSCELSDVSAGNQSGPQ